MPASPPTPAAAFLVHFDMRQGYRLVWSRGDLDLSGIEYKALPSGIHAHTATTVYLTHESKGRLYYGLARFRQLNGNKSGATDRSLVKMYAVGILSEPISGPHWKPAEFASGGWEHVRSLDVLLQALLKDEKPEHMEQLWASLTERKDANTDIHSENIHSENLDTKKAKRDHETAKDVSKDQSSLLGLDGLDTLAHPTDHPLAQLPAALALVGPLIFPIFKRSLLRQSVLVFVGEAERGNEAAKDEDNERERENDRESENENENEGERTNGEINVSDNDQESESRRDYAKDGSASSSSFLLATTSHSLASALVYLISLLSVVPSDVRFEPRDDSHLLFSQPLYSVGLHDLDTGLFGHHKGYVACTADDILRQQRQLYDLAVVLPATSAESCNAYTSKNEPVRATFNDYAKFCRVFRQLPEKPGDDVSIRTATSQTERLEPTWWLHNATLPMSWREYVWLAFAWFASAGSTSREETDNMAWETQQETDDHQYRQQWFRQLAHVVGGFHRLTKKWFYVVEEIVAEAVEEQGEGATLRLTHQDVVDMELDPYAEQDVSFIEEFVLLYWGSVVDAVEIGIGFENICC